MSNVETILPGGFNFDADAHEYRLLNGQVVPGTTEIIESFTGLYDDKPEWLKKVMKAKGIIGTNVHKAAERLDGGEGYDDIAGSLEPREKRYFGSYYSFATGYNLEPVEMESMCVAGIEYAGRIVRYGMTLDKLAWITVDAGRELWLLDLKCTSKTNFHKWSLQLAAYMNGIKNRPGNLPVPTRAGIVHLSETGPGKLLEIVPEQSHIGTFAAAAYVYDYFQVAEQRKDEQRRKEGPCPDRRNVIPMNQTRTAQSARPV